MRYPKATLEATLASAPISITCASHSEALRLRWALYRAKGHHQVELVVVGSEVLINRRTSITLESKNG